MEDIMKFRKFLSNSRYGYGNGSGDGSGDGYGYGYGSGDGSGYGDGYGSGDGPRIGKFCGEHVFQIDGISTIFRQIKGNVAKGLILNQDFTTVSCWVVKLDGMFSHGETLRAAMKSAKEKVFQNMTEDERIDAFISEHKFGVKYATRDLYDWHHRLTGSCEMGRKKFAFQHGIDLECGKMTVKQFIDLTKHSYGGDIICKLEKAMLKKYEK